MGKFQQSQNQLRNETRHRFLKTFFDNEEGYEIKEVNGCFLVKQWNGGTQRWEVAIFSPESFIKRQNFITKQSK